MQSPRILICWAGISGYLAACWSAAVSQGFDVKIITFHDDPNAPFARSLSDGLPIAFTNASRASDYGELKEHVRAFAPDVIVICGWFIPNYVRLVHDSEFTGSRVMVAIDTPWQGSARQTVARFALRRLVRRSTYALVPGERAFQYAMRLGFSDDQIIRGMYAVDYQRFAQAAVRRRTQPAWPRRFLFTGRYCRVKGLDILREAYSMYRTRVDEPWSLACCGAGPMAAILDGEPGIENLGFVQPREQVEVFSRAGAFVLPSRYDPWPLVVVEACAAGLPIVCTPMCGSGVELLRDGYNGFWSGSRPSALCETLCRVHRVADIGLLGARSEELARAYGSEYWPTRAFGRLR